MRGGFGDKEVDFVFRQFYSNQMFAKVSYGLSERFQLAENIKTCKVGILGIQKIQKTGW